MDEWQLSSVSDLKAVGPQWTHNWRSILNWGRIDDSLCIAVETFTMRSKSTYKEIFISDLQSQAGLGKWGA
jgi:hypothetical protein